MNYQNYQQMRILILVNDMVTCLQHNALSAMVHGKVTSFHKCILSVSEKLPVSKFQYFGKCIIPLYGYFYVHVSGQRLTGLER